MSNKSYFLNQFMDISPEKLARRQRFMRRVQNRMHHQMGNTKPRKLLKRRFNKPTLT